MNMKLLILGRVVEDDVQDKCDAGKNDAKVVAPSPSSSSVEDK